MGCYRVIHMGLPIIVGVCQQASTPDPPAISFSINQVQTNTVNYGTGLGSTAISPSQQVQGTLDSNNSWVWPSNTLFTMYGPAPGEDVQVNHSFNVQIDASGIPDSSLPTDGNCQVNYGFTFDSERTPVRFWDLEFEDIYNGGNSPAVFTFNGLDRSRINGEGSAQPLPSLVEANDYSLFTPIPSFEGQVTITVAILLADDTFIQQSQTLQTSDLSISDFLNV